jgi:hypothetical protein
MLPRVTSIGNTGTPSGEIARAGQVFGGSGDTARGLIGLPGASYEPVSKEGTFESALEQCRAFLTAIFSPGDWICFHAVGAPTGADKLQDRRWERLGDGGISRALEFVWRYNTRHSHKCQPFFSGNPRRGPGQDKAAGTSHARCHYADWDGISVQDALRMIGEAGLPQPTVILFSGKGTHAYWSLLEAVHDPEVWEHRQKWLAAALKSDASISDWQRKMRLPGFYNVKEKYAPDYPLSRLVHVDRSLRYAWEQLKPTGTPEPAKPLPRLTPEQLAALPPLPAGSMSTFSKKFLEEKWVPKGRSRRMTGFAVWQDLAARGWSLEAVLPLALRAMQSHGLSGRDLEDIPRQVAGAFSRNPTAIRDDVGPQPVRIELLEQSPPPFVPLDEWRRELALEVAIEADRPGLKLLRGDPGCGKTYAVARAMAKKSRGVTSAPAHELCGEIVETLRQCGVDAVAYPKLDESTCENYGEAKRAQAAGLSVAACVCSTACPFKDDCRRSGYLALVAAAEKAPHKVVTHERLARSADRLCEKADYLTIEEDPSALLRPSVTGNRKQLERVAELADELAEAGERFWILEGVDLVPQPAPVVEESQLLAEFAEWAPAPDGKKQVETESSPPAKRDTNRGGFFERLCSIAEDLSQHCRRAIRDELPDGMHALPLPTVGAIPKNPEGTVWHALETLRRVDGGELLEIKPELRDALTLALNAATGRLDALYLQVDTERDDRKPDDKPRRMARVVGFWRTSLPFDRVPVYVNDGTSDRGLLEQLTGQAVVDITPAGRVALAHPCEHYPVDILPTTSTAKVARILTGIVRAHPDRHRVGLVLLKRHREELLFPEDGEHLLPKDVRERIEWSTYYGAGDDRGSNELHRRCDLAVVLGTFRPPPREVRRKLAQRGRLEAANTAGTWGMVERHAATPAGAETHYAGRGYAEVEWATAADSLTRAAVRQAVGRARAICPTKGVPVVVCTTESVGLPVLEAGALPVAQPRLDVLVEGFSRLPTLPEYRAKNPNSIIRESCAILGQPSATVPELEQVLPDVAPRTLQLWLREAIDAGLVVRSGAARATRYELAPGVVVPAPTLQAQLFSAEPAEAPPDPVPVVDDPRELDWLEPLLAPERNPITLSDVRWIHEQHVQTLGSWPTWQRECTPPLVRHLHRIAAKEASSRGQPPPPLEMVAGHTVAWHALTCQVA